MKRTLAGLVAITFLSSSPQAKTLEAPGVFVPTQDQPVQPKRQSMEEMLDYLVDYAIREKSGHYASSFTITKDNSVETFGFSITVDRVTTRPASISLFANYFNLPSSGEYTLNRVQRFRKKYDITNGNADNELLGEIPILVNKPVINNYFLAVLDVIIEERRDGSPTDDTLVRYKKAEEALMGINPVTPTI